MFLSYASEDAAAAQRICEALRAGGIEVWFDQSELRGGDAWDRAIRQQIHDCALFVPVISRHTHERLEGYFRREWKLAVDRTHDMAEIKAFLVPVVVDDTPERDPAVPEKFRELQWTRLPAGETPPAFVERIERLLAGEAAQYRSPDSVFAGSGSTARAAHRRRIRVVYAAIVAAALLAFGYAGYERIRGAGSRPHEKASIAVLPLANESGDPGQQYFSDGISEELISALSQFPGLKVIGRTSAFQFRDSKEDSRTIGAKLGVTHLLEGSVRRSGDTVRVLAELIETDDGSTKWSERYDRPYKEIFALQDEITRAVVAALRTRLLPGEHAQAQGERPPSGNLEAYNALLQGKFHSRRNTNGDLPKAIEYLTRATEIDPDYALAWSELGQAWVFLGANALRGEPEREAYAKSHLAVDRALALAPDLAAAHIGRGFVLMIADLNWRGGEAEFRRALELAPNDAEAQHSLAILLGALGEAQQAIDLTRRALIAEPLRSNSYVWLAWYEARLNRLDEAERAIRRGIELQPNNTGTYVILATIEVMRGNAPAALAAAEQEADPEDRAVAIALARQAGADRRSADAALRKLVDEHGDSYPWGVARVYALRNEADRTFEWLDRAWKNRQPELIYLLLDPLFLPYRNDPRFAAFCRKVGLPVPGETPARKTS